MCPARFITSKLQLFETSLLWDGHFQYDNKLYQGMYPHRMFQEHESELLYLQQPVLSLNLKGTLLGCLGEVESAVYVLLDDDSYI